MLLGKFKIFLRVDLAVASGNVNMRELLAGFDHMLEQVDEVGLLERLGLTERMAGELVAAAVIIFAQSGGSGSGELGHAGVFAMGLGLRRAALDARDASVGHGHFLGIIARVLTAIGVVGEPFRVDDKRPRRRDEPALGQRHRA